MAEELVFNVKSNIKGVTQELDVLNNTLSDQKKILLELQKEELKLQQERDNQSAYEQGLSGINDKIKKINNSIKDQKLAVKGMTQEQREANAKLREYNKAQKEQEKAIKGSIGNFQVMGVSLNGIKKSVSGIIPLIKMMFKSITAGLLSTGLGAFVIAFGSLVTYVTSTKEGMDKLSVTMAKIGATFNVVKDRVAGFGKIVGNIFNKKISETISDVKDNFAGMGEEIKEETKAAGELEKATQKLRDTENKFIVTQAKKNKQIAEARLLSEDETVAAKKRLQALKNAQKLEKELVADEVANQKERVRILEEKTNMSNSTAADEKALADARVVLINVETKSLKQQKKLAREMNSLEKEIAADAKAITDKKAEDDAKAEQKRKDAAKKRKDEAASLLEIQQQNTLDLIDDLTKRAFEELKIQEQKELASVALMDNAEEMKLAIQKKFDIKRGKLEDAVKDKGEKDDKAIKDMKIKFATDTLGAISKIAGEETKIGKAAAVAQATVSGTQSVINTFKTASDSPLNALIPGYNFIQAGIAAGFAAKTIKDIASSKPPSAGGGGGGSAAPSTPAPQMMSGAFELGGGVAPEPVKAFVVTDEMTSSQNQLANIRRTATI